MGACAAATIRTAATQSRYNGRSSRHGAWQHRWRIWRNSTANSRRAFPDCAFITRVCANSRARHAVRAHDCALRPSRHTLASGFECVETGRFAMFHRFAMLLFVSLVIPNAVAQESRLDAVQKMGTLRVCTPGDYRPFSLAKSDGGYEGIDVDLVQAMAKSFGVKVEFV